MPDSMKPMLAREMEVYAGFLEHVDYHVGLLIDALEDLEILDDTLVYYIIGDNGASAEGSPTGTFNEMISLNATGELLGLMLPLMSNAEFIAEQTDKLGTPASYNHYAVGWAH